MWNDWLCELCLQWSLSDSIGENDWTCTDYSRWICSIGNCKIDVIRCKDKMYFIGFSRIDVF